MCRLTRSNPFLLAALLITLVVAGASWGQTWTPAPRPAPPVGAPGPGAAVLAEVEAFIYRFINEIRARHNFAPLERDEALEALARTHCEDMLARRYFSHYTPEGLPPKDRVMPAFPRPLYRLGENIWKGFDQYLNNAERLARFIVDSWMNSPGHRDNVFGVDYTHLGVGVAVRGRDIRAVQLFANLKGHNPF